MWLRSRNRRAAAPVPEGVGNYGGGAAIGGGDSWRDERRVDRVPAGSDGKESMNVQVNLASQQFRRDRPLLVGSAVAGILLLALLVMLISLNLGEQGRLQSTQAEIDVLDRKLRSVAAEQAKLDAVLRKPENAQVLDYSVLINSLLYRKGISWTRIFADLEKVVPYNVRLISIRPAVNAQNQIVLEMHVGAE